MTRVYIQPSWLNAAEDHNQWSGGNDQYRGDRSVDISTFDKNGRARVEAFSDAAIEALKEKKKTSIPLVDRILPQQKRVKVLTDQLIELEQAKKDGMDIHTYSKLRDVLIVKRDRAEVLYKKAISVRPVRDEDDYDHYEKSNTNSYETPASTTAGVSHKGSDTERKNSWVKLRINVPKDLVFFLTGSVGLLSFFTWLVN